MENADRKHGNLNVLPKKGDIILGKIKSVSNGKCW